MKPKKKKKSGPINGTHDAYGRKFDSRPIQPSPLFEPLDTPVAKPLPNVAPATRASHPSTSRRAAASVNKQDITYRGILSVLGDDALTDEEINERFAALGIPFSDSGLRARRKELQRGGFVRFVDDKGTTKHNRACARWSRTELVYDGEPETIRAMKLDPEKVG